MPPCHSSQGQRLCWVPPWGSVPSALPALSLDRSPRAPPLMGVKLLLPGGGSSRFQREPTRAPRTPRGPETLALSPLNPLPSAPGPSGPHSCSRVLPRSPTAGPSALLLVSALAEWPGLSRARWPLHQAQGHQGQQQQGHYCYSGRVRVCWPCAKLPPSRDSPAGRGRGAVSWGDRGWAEWTDGGQDSGGSEQLGGTT